MRRRCEHRVPLWHDCFGHAGYYALCALLALAFHLLWDFSLYSSACPQCLLHALCFFVFCLQLVLGLPPRAAVAAVWLLCLQWLPWLHSILARSAMLARMVLFSSAVLLLLSAARPPTASLAAVGLSSAFALGSFGLQLYFSCTPHMGVLSTSSMLPTRGTPPLSRASWLWCRNHSVY